MIFKTFHKMMSFALALLVLLSTLSFTMEKHFCGDTLIDVAIFTKAETCGMDLQAASKVTSDKKSCCKDELEIVKGQDKLKKATSEDFQIAPQLFLKAFIYAFNSLFEELPNQTIPHQNYAPPILVTDIQVLDQVFII